MTREIRRASGRRVGSRPRDEVRWGGRRGTRRTTGFAAVEDTSAETLIAEGLADALDVSFSAVRLLNPWAALPGDLSDDSILHVVDGVDVPEPMTFAYTEAEFLLERASTFRSRLKDVSDEDFRAWMRTRPRIAHLADAELPRAGDLHRPVDSALPRPPGPGRAGLRRGAGHREDLLAPESTR